jgi:hypothetical protein
MTFDEFDDDDLATIRQQLEQLVQERGVPFAEIQVTQSLESSLLEATAIGTSDPFLDSTGNAAHRQIRISVTMFTESPETDRDVLWGRMSYSVETAHSDFFPVSDEYGDHITIQFNWEFDRETLEHRSAEVRDRGSLHCVSVLPNPQFVAFVECCSEVAEEWAP